MQTITIDIINDKVLQLLKELEQMHFIKVRENKKQEVNKISELKGKLKLTAEQSKDLHQYLKDIRNEWERDI